MDFKYITITPDPNVARCWHIRNKISKKIIGGIEWFPDWKKLVLSPEYMTVWSIECLEDVAKFIREETKKLK